MTSITEAVLKALRPSPDGDRALPLMDDHDPVPIGDHYHELPAACEERVTYIDGGNAEIIGAATFSLQRVKIATVTYDGRQKTGQSVMDVTLLVTFDGKFSVTTYPEDRLDITFSPTDPDLTTRGTRATAQRVAGVCRRLLELEEAASCDGLTVLDGALIPTTRYEEPYVDALGEDVIGVAKSSRIVTDKGKVFAAVIDTDGTWYYHPVYRNGLDVSFARLHPQSDHVFRVDMQSFEPRRLAAIRVVADDPVFPGYPYGLVEADRLARVSNAEASYMRTKLMTQFGDDWSVVESYLHTTDAHDVLDSIG
jgi:hypothetical protein